MQPELQNYEEQRQIWPRSGRHILAQYDESSIVVYQAYRPEIGHFAARHGCFGGAFSLDRMSWIKPNFLWMMYRCGWATKPDQEVVLAVRIRREAFDAILAAAVHSSFVAEVCSTQEQWKHALASSDVRLQWDPDHEPTGKPLDRRAIQLGLRGQTLRRYAQEWILGIEDITALVHEQRQNLANRTLLMTPRERVYPVCDPAVAARLGIERDRDR